MGETYRTERGRRRGPIEEVSSQVRSGDCPLRGHLFCFRDENTLRTTSLHFIHFSLFSYIIVRMYNTWVDKWFLNSKGKVSHLNNDRVVLIPKIKGRKKDRPTLVQYLRTITLPSSLYTQ